jgi:hypothetical protein
LEDLRIPRVRTTFLRPCFVEPYKRAGYQLEELIVAMYSGGCSKKGASFEPSMHLLMKDTLLHGYPPSTEEDEREDRSIQKKKAYKMVSHCILKWSMH